MDSGKEANADWHHQDFCLHTDSSLKTPLRQDQARTLLFSSFSQSIACTIRGPSGRCDVCEPSASGLFDALRAMPRLRTVRVDFSRHAREMLRLLDSGSGVVAEDEEGGDGDEDGRCWRRLRGEAVRGLDVKAVAKVHVSQVHHPWT